MYGKRSDWLKNNDFYVKKYIFKLINNGILHKPRKSERYTNFYKTTILIMMVSRKSKPLYMHTSQACFFLHKSRKQIFTRQQLYDYEQKRCFLENTILNSNQKAIRCVHKGCLSAYSRIVSLHFIFDFDLSSILNLPGFNNPIGFSLSSHCYKLILKI